MTTVSAVLRMAKKDVGVYLDRPLEEILTMPEVQHVFDSIKLGATVPTPPVLIVQAVHDYLIDVDDIDELADTYSAGGADVTYHRDAFNEHLLLHPLSAPMTLRWLQDRFARRPLTDHLVRTKWPTMFNPATYVGMARLAVIAGKVITGKTRAAPPAMTASKSAPPRLSGCAVSTGGIAAEIIACGRRGRYRIHQRGGARGHQQRAGDLQRHCVRRTPAAPR